MKFRLDIGFEVQPRNRPRLRLAVFAIMRLAPDPVGHRVPQTKLVGVLTRQPTKVSTQGRHLWPHRDRELKGETCGTQFRQVRAVRCVIPYNLYDVLKR
jgi:hypothetical protein